MAKKKEYDLTDRFWIIMDRTVSPNKLNPVEWINIIHQCLDSCGSVLRKAFLKNNKMRTLVEYMNYSLKGSIDEKRIMSDEVLKTLPKQFTLHGWQLIPVKTLEKKEEKGQFFERKLFICIERAALVIVDTKFRKDPHDNQKVKKDPPKINENVVSCEILVDDSDVGDKEKFKEMIIPYLEGSSLGKDIISYHLDPVVDMLREMKSEVKKTEKDLKSFLGIRSRMDIFNHID